MPESGDTPTDARTALPGSTTEEAHPDVDPQTPGGAMDKLKQEVAEGDSPLDKAKRAIEEVDRQVSGEYERREDPEERSGGLSDTQTGA
jgi:hypothetical protein